MIAAPSLLRADLLQGTAILVAGAGGQPRGRQAPLAGVVASACAQLGADVVTLELAAETGDGVQEASVEQALSSALGERRPPAVLLVDAASFFAGAGGGRAGLGVSLELSWAVTRAVAAELFLPREGREGGGRVVYAAPAAQAGEHAAAVAAGLENLGRTLSIEWARHGITTVAIAPGESTSADEIAALCAYLASPAGAYFSGCLLDLRGAARAEA